MDTQSTAATVGQYLEISPGLGGFYDSESVFLVGHTQIGGVIAGDLQEDSGIWAAFVSLSGGVQEARAESQTGCCVLFVAHGVAEFLQLSFMFRSHLDEA